ncbi:MAG TPA: flagellar hook-length control protein FliK [Phycisphaerae bacterium]|nr:flagellar hook-length control protein FliK [Phycisphaerae bacterium]
MSTVKTLVPAPAGAADASQNARGAFAIPMPRSIPAAVAEPRDGVESSFRSLLTQVSQRDRSAEAPDDAAKAVRKGRKPESATDGRSTESADRAERNRKPGPARQSEKVRETERKRPSQDDDAVAQESPTGAERADETAPAPVGSREDSADVACTQSDAASESGPSQESSQPGDANAVSPAVETSKEGVLHPAEELLRQLAARSCGGQVPPGGSAAVADAGVVTLQAGIAPANRDMDTQTVAGPSDATTTQPQADSRASQSFSGAPDAIRAADVRRDGLVPGGPLGPSPSSAMDLGPLTPVPASPGSELARLVALAAGLADGGSPDTASRSEPASLAASARSDPRQGQQPGTDQAEAHAAMIPPGSRPAPNLTTPHAESFAQVLAGGRLSPAGQAANVDRVAELVRANVGAKNSSITIRLDPPELGRIQLDARLRDDVLSIHVQAETAAARDLLLSRVDDLRHALTRQGITIDRFDIDPRPAAPTHGGQSPGDRNPNGQQPSGDGGAAQQWQQRDASSGSAWTGGRDGAAPAPEVEAAGVGAGNEAASGRSAEGVGTMVTTMPGAPGRSVNMWA